VSISVDQRQSIHIARQPILNAAGAVFGYELLYRAQETDGNCESSSDLASARVLTDALLGIGLDALTGGAPAFVNFTKQLLLDNVAALLPAQSIVIELHEDIVVDDQVIEACRALKGKGYTLALDDYVAGSGADALLPYATFVKLDVLDPPLATWQSNARRLSQSGLRVIAERVETRDILIRARDAGCTLFQGYYFCKPSMQNVKTLPTRRLAYLNLFSAINQPDLTVNAVETLVKQDVSLTMRVLRSINSTAFALGQPITSVRHALVLLGVDQVRKWASIWAMAGLNSGGSPEVVSLALLRARTCELVGQEWSGPETGAELFLLGMCSMLPAILDQPMEEAIGGLQLTTAVRDALLDKPSPTRSVLDAVIAHEQGDWDRTEQILTALGLAPTVVSNSYAGALRWTREVSSAATA